MLMKTSALLLSFSLILATGAFAGTVATYSGKSAKQTIMPPQELPCFGTGWDIGIFGGGLLPRHQDGDFNNSGGGGALAEYFFTENIGIQVSYGAYAAEGTTHVINGDLVLRAPIQSICVAPYLLLGGGMNVDGVKQGEYHAGVGIEARFKSMNNIGIFVDGTYNWHSSSNRDRDFTLVRLGVKFHL